VGSTFGKRFAAACTFVAVGVAVAGCRSTRPLESIRTESIRTGSIRFDPIRVESIPIESMDSLVARDPAPEHPRLDEDLLALGWMFPQICRMRPEPDGNDDVRVEEASVTALGGCDCASSCPAVELCLSVSTQEVDAHANEDHLVYGRDSLGGRLTFDSQTFQPYVRAGLFRRFGREDADVIGPDQNDNGWYGGVGLDWAWAKDATIGPFYAIYGGSGGYGGDHGRGEESILGIAVMLRL
jgi:hypothetical protein